MADKTKQVTRGHNIIADGWAEASNPHPHPNSPPTLKNTQKLFLCKFIIPTNPFSVTKLFFEHFDTPNIGFVGTLSDACDIGLMTMFPIVSADRNAISI